MNSWLMYLPSIFVVPIVAYFVYILATRGFKGLVFVPRIASTHDGAIKYRVRGVKHTILIHELEKPGFYGIEIGQWTGPAGGTTGVEIPKSELIKLRNLISTALESPND